jgi:hypothetical protein
LLLTGLPWPIFRQALTLVLPSLRALPSEVIIVAQESSCCRHLHQHSISQQFVWFNLKLVATAKIPGFQNPEFQCTKLLVNIAFNGSICRRGEIRSRALSDIFRTFSPYLTEGRSTEEM